jgi:hypothetical protein
MSECMRMDATGLRAHAYAHRMEELITISVCLKADCYDHTSPYHYIYMYAFMCFGKGICMHTCGIYLYMYGIYMRLPTCT